MAQKFQAYRSQLEILPGLGNLVVSLVPLGNLRFSPLLRWGYPLTSQDSRVFLVIVERSFIQELEIWQDLDFRGSPLLRSLTLPVLEDVSPVEGAKIRTGRDSQ